MGWKEGRVGWAEKVGVEGVEGVGCGRMGMSMGRSVTSGTRRPQWERRYSKVSCIPEADVRPCGGSCSGSWFWVQIWLLGRQEEWCDSSWDHLRIQCVRLRFRGEFGEFGEDVAASWVKLMELVWSIVSKLLDVWRGVLVGGSLTRTWLEHFGGGWRSTTDVWASLVVWSMG